MAAYTRASGIAALRTVRLVVSGTVQGVGFRSFAVRAARRHGVRGWVRNRSDGAVEIAAQGAPPDFFEEIAIGPRFGRVAAVDRSETDEPEVHGFDVRW